MPRRSRSRERGWLARALGLGKPGPKERAELRRRALEEQKQRSFERTYLRRVDADRRKDRRERVRDELEAKHAERERLKEQRALDLERAAAARARAKAAREEERSKRLEEQAGKARTTTRRKEAEAKAETATKRADKLDDVASRIERGEYTPGELRELMASGALSLKHNPSFQHPPADREGIEPLASAEGHSSKNVDPELRAAMAGSQTLHGVPTEVLKLSAEDRKVSRYLVDVGDMPDVEYVTDDHSRRAGYEWDHEIGDRGDLLPRSKTDLRLGWDPLNRKLVIVPLRNEMELSDRGLLG